MHEDTIRELFQLREAASAANNSTWRKAFNAANYDLCNTITDHMKKIDDAFFNTIRSLRDDIAL